MAMSELSNDEVLLAYFIFFLILSLTNVLPELPRFFEEKLSMCFK